VLIETIGCAILSSCGLMLLLELLQPFASPYWRLEVLTNASVGAAHFSDIQFAVLVRTAVHALLKAKINHPVRHELKFCAYQV
jgi:hypothetical protein